MSSSSYSGSTPSPLAQQFASTGSSTGGEQKRSGSTPNSKCSSTHQTPNEGASQVQVPYEFTTVTPGIHVESFTKGMSESEAEAKMEELKNVTFKEGTKGERILTPFRNAVCSVMLKWLEVEGIRIEEKKASDMFYARDYIGLKTPVWGEPDGLLFQTIEASGMGAIIVVGIIEDKHGVSGDTDETSAKMQQLLNYMSAAQYANAGLTTVGLFLSTKKNQQDFNKLAGDKDEAKLRKFPRAVDLRVVFPGARVTSDDECFEARLVAMLPRRLDKPTYGVLEFHLCGGFFDVMWLFTKGCVSILSDILKHRSDRQLKVGEDSTMGKMFEGQSEGGSNHILGKVVRQTQGDCRSEATRAVGQTEADYMEDARKEVELYFEQDHDELPPLLRKNVVLQDLLPQSLSDKGLVYKVDGDGTAEQGGPEQRILKIITPQMDSFGCTLSSFPNWNSRMKGILGYDIKIWNRISFAYDAPVLFPLGTDFSPRVLRRIKISSVVDDLLNIAESSKKCKLFYNDYRLPNVAFKKPEKTGDNSVTLVDLDSYRERSYSVWGRPYGECLTCKKAGHMCKQTKECEAAKKWKVDRYYLADEGNRQHLYQILLLATSLKRKKLPSNPVIFTAEECGNGDLGTLTTLLLQEAIASARECTGQPSDDLMSTEPDELWQEVSRLLKCPEWDEVDTTEAQEGSGA